MRIGRAGTKGPRTNGLRVDDRMSSTPSSGLTRSNGRRTPSTSPGPSAGPARSTGPASPTGRALSSGRRSLNARQRLARRTRWRRWAAAGLAGIAAVVTLSALAPRATQSGGREVLVAMRDLPAGAVVTRDDVEVVRRPVSTVPQTALTAYADVVGRTTATPVSTRDVVTSERLVGAALLTGQPAGSVAMSVPVLDVGEATRPGTRVDLYATGSGDAAASDVVVLAVRRPAESASVLGGGSSPQLTVALDTADAARIARSLSTLDGGQGLIVAVRLPTGLSQ